MEARTVVIDAVVTDRRGRSVSDLTKGDFRVYENGVPQKIDFFEPHLIAALTKTGTPTALPQNTFSNAPQTAPEGAMSVLLIDALNTNGADQVSVRRQMLEYLNGLPDGVPIAVMVLGDQLRIVQGFSSDSARRYSSAAQLLRGPTQPVSRSLSSDSNAQNSSLSSLQSIDSGSLAGGQSSAAIAALQQFLNHADNVQQNQQVLATLEAIQAIGRYLSPIPGRKNLIWLSGSFPLCIPGITSSNANCPYEDVVEKTVDMLAAARVSLYPIDAGGISAPNSDIGGKGEDASGSLVPGTSIGGPHPAANYAADIFRNMAADRMAEETGGKAFHGNDLRKEIADAVDHGSRYYVLAYTPTNQREKNRARRIEIRLTSGDYNISYRRSYFEDDSNQSTTETQRAPADPLRPLMMLGMPNFFQVQYQVEVEPASAKGRDSHFAGDNPSAQRPTKRYSVRFLVSPETIHLQTDQDGVRHGRVEVSLVARGENGNALNWMVRDVGLAVRPEQLAQSLESGITLHFDFDMPEGASYMSSGVYDPSTNHVGTLGIPLTSVRSPAVVSVPVRGPMTVDQLEQYLSSEDERGDKGLTHRLENIELTQRLSTMRLEKLQATLPGPESRSSLLAVADLSEVLDLPPGEIPADPPPTPAEQQQMLSRAYAASGSSADQLPDFNTTATLTRFRNLKYLSSGHSVPVPLVVHVPLLLDRDTDVVTHREGRIFITHTSQTWAPGDSVKTGVESWDGLYALLTNLLRDMRSAQSEWVRWEQAPTGKLAVFAFSVDENHAHFPIRTVIDPSRRRGFVGQPGYHAEVALDPATSTVHRFVLHATLNPGQHVSRADAVVEFGKVIVEGKPFLCPLRAVTIGVTQSLLGDFNVHSTDFDFQVSEDIRPLTHIIDVEFGDYRPGESKPPATADPTFLSAALKLTGERMTVEQLEKLVQGLHGGDDKALASRLVQIELTQRLTAERYARMRDGLPGKTSADALSVLYDLSEFDDLPQADLLRDAAPDTATQGEIFASAVAFVAKMANKMPDLFATRQLARFEDLKVVRGAPQPLSEEVKPLVMVDQSTATVHFREGREVVESASQGAQQKSTEYGLDTWGTFGPILEIVMTDVLNAKIGWSHWEHGPSGRVAVFRYAVPEASSHINVRFCCYLGNDGLPSSFVATPGYHGELTIDPSAGAVLRLALKADLNSDLAQHTGQEKSPLLRSDVLVEYGSVDIGGKQYLCPRRTVSIMTSWTLGSQGPLKKPVTKAEGLKTAKKALALMEFSRVNAINEGVFHDYHVFRSEMRVVSGTTEESPAVPKP